MEALVANLEGDYLWEAVVVVADEDDDEDCRRMVDYSMEHYCKHPQQQQYMD